jgi:hypothetical protein
MGSRSLILALSASAAVALWSASAIVAGIFWMIRDSTYVNAVMTAALALAFTITAGALVVVARLWHRLNDQSSRV